MLILLATLALAEPPRVCLTADEFRARILEPLHQLERCQREVEIVTDERDRLHGALRQTVTDLRSEQAARVEAERRTRRARRGQPRAAGAGAGAVLAVVLLLVLL